MAKAYDSTSSAGNPALAVSGSITSIKSADFLTGMASTPLQKMTMVPDGVLLDDAD
jgi:hypothetical protein